VSVPLVGALRVRGYVSGADDSSGWFVETLWPPQPRLVEPRWLDPATFAFTLLGQTNRTHRIESSFDFVKWSEVLRLTNPPPAAPITLPITPGQPRQFFRALLP
jgi:hypothetical protein